MTRIARGLMAAICALLLSSCASLSHGFLAAAGPVADEQREVYVIVAIVMIFVAGPVLVLVPAFAWHYRLSNTKDAYRPRWDFSWRLEGLIWIPPILIVLGLAVLVWIYTHRLDPYRPLPGGAPEEIDTIALDWKWLFIHRESGVAEVNRLTVPVGRPVHLRLTSATVMQSILIPRLAGQIYTMAGMTTHLNLRADKPGRYRGENTQYNGAGFARQSFEVVALPPDVYVAWQRQAAAAPRFDSPISRRVFAKTTMNPATFSRVPAGLFERLVTRTGGSAHPHKAK